MKLKYILQEIDYGLNKNINLSDEIDFITSDSRIVRKNSIFVAMKGDRFDGHKYVEGAVKSGAKYIVLEKDMGFKNQIIVKNSRKSYALMQANINGNPSTKLKIIGITGTNGKTTVSTVIKQALEHMGKKIGLIGTVGNYIGSMMLPAKHTTPDPKELHVLLGKMKRAGCEYVIMEVSSHGLHQYRLEGCHFDIGVFTNLTPEHLDYHGNMENYYQAKKELFNISKKALICIDDEYGKRLCDELKQDNKFKKNNIKIYSIKNEKADYCPEDVKKSATSVNFNIMINKKIEKINFNMPGNYSLANAVSAVAVLNLIGIDSKNIGVGISEAGYVSGRTEVIYNKEFTVIRDYAHSPDGLYNLLSTIKEFSKKRVLCLFGCPGRRDKEKRPKMGEVVAKLSDYYIISSDNPREENEMDIINETLLGAKKHNKNYEIFLDRYIGIKRILEMAKKDDIVILAGKGHEDYQVLSYGTIVFDEKEIVEKLLLI